MSDTEFPSEQQRAAQKTPVSLLHELCLQNDISAEYQLMHVEGAYHAPTFMFKVQVGDVEATATGSSKKKAKHASALAMLEKLLANEGGYSEGFEVEGVLVNADTLHDVVFNPCSNSSEDGQKNSVGLLQEHCMKYHLQPPYYEVKEESGLPHEKLFTMSCNVGFYSGIGRAKSKRLAKREAASIVLDALQENMLGSEPDEQLEENEGVAETSPHEDDAESAQNLNEESRDPEENIKDKERENGQVLIEENAEDKKTENGQVLDEKENAENGQVLIDENAEDEKTENGQVLDEKENAENGQVLIEEKAENGQVFDEKENAENGQVVIEENAENGQVVIEENAEDEKTENGQVLDEKENAENGQVSSVVDEERKYGEISDEDEEEEEEKGERNDKLHAENLRNLITALTTSD